MASLARVVLTGPECTGKTTLAARLAGEHGAVWVPEHARAYAAARGARLGPADVEPIARGQMAAEDAAAGRASGLLVLDTDLLSTVVYARHYYGACPEWVEAEARRRRADLFLLLATGVPWLPDGVRDAGGEARERLFEAFRAALVEIGARFEVVGGGWDERAAAARRQVAALLAERNVER